MSSHIIRFFVNRSVRSAHGIYSDLIWRLFVWWDFSFEIWKWMRLVVVGATAPWNGQAHLQLKFKLSKRYAHSVVNHSWCARNPGTWNTKIEKDRHLSILTGLMGGRQAGSNPFVRMFVCVCVRACGCQRNVIYSSVRTQWARSHSINSLKYFSGKMTNKDKSKIQCKNISRGFVVGEEPINYVQQHNECRKMCFFFCLFSR